MTELNFYSLHDAKEIKKLTFICFIKLINMRD